jgi:hypothetical protein
MWLIYAIAAMDIKTFINVLKVPEKKVKTEKEKQKRIITETKKWDFCQSDLLYENQWSLIMQLYNKNITNREHCDVIRQQIHRKIYGYRAQDIEKGLLDESKFIDEEHVLSAMIECKNMCFYCKREVDVLYEFVREPNQWSLDRLNNDFGHNKDNVVISCLRCNLRRKTMHHERYVFTKQLVISKMNS